MTTKIGVQILERLFQGQIPAASINLVHDQINLGQSFQNKDWEGSMGSNKDETEVFVWDMSSGLKKLEISIGECSGSNYAHSSRTDEDGERLIDALLRLQTPPTHIAIRNRGYNQWEGSESSDWDKLDIYRISEGEIKAFAETELFAQKAAIFSFFRIAE